MITNKTMLIGRLTSDPVTFTNANGSKKIKVNIACRNNWTNTDGTVGSQFIPVEQFVQAGKNGSLGYCGKGDLVAIEASLRTNNYTDKNGQAIFSTVVLVDTVEFLEPKAVKEARKTQATVPATAPVQA